jgi:hypothetical protein
MSCSYCHVAGHRITNCQSVDLLRLVDKLEGIVRDLKRQPLTYMDSHALNLHGHICDLFARTLFRISTSTLGDELGHDLGQRSPQQKIKQKIRQRSQTNT